MKLNIEKTNIALFIVYSIAYLANVSGYLNRKIYMLILGCFTLVLLVEIFKGIYYKRQFYFTSETIEILSIALLFFLISIFIQLIHYNFKTYVFTELIYFILPVLIAFTAVNYGGQRSAKVFLYIIFFRSILYFLLKNWNNFSISAIMSISFSDTGSSVFEMVIAHYFLFFMIIFGYLKHYGFATVSAILCLLCFKRLPFILTFPCYAMILSYSFIGKKSPQLSSRISLWLCSPVSHSIAILVWFVCLTLPFLMIWLYTGNGNAWFSSLFHINLNQFTTGRALSITTALKNCHFNGLGSCRNYYTSIKSSSQSMHCDVIRLYKEITLPGYAAYCAIVIHVLRKRRILFCMLMYIFMEMTISHIIDGLGMNSILYLFAAYLYIDNITTSNTSEKSPLFNKERIL